MKKIIRLTESDLTRLVKRVIKETQMGGPKITPKDNYNNMLNFLNNTVFVNERNEKIQIVAEGKPDLTYREIYVSYEGIQIIKMVITSSNGCALYMTGPLASKQPIINYWYKKSKTCRSYSPSGNSDLFGISWEKPKDFYDDLKLFFKEHSPSKFVGNSSANQVYYK